MKVLHVEAGRHRYGGAAQVGYLVDGLGARGVRNWLAAPPGQPLLAAGLSAEPLPMTMRGDADALMLPRLMRCITRLQPDVVHVHSRRGADIWGGLAATLSGVPAVLTRRVESTEPGMALRMRCRPYARVVAISRTVAAELARAGVDSARCRLIPSAVDPRRFAPPAEARASLRRAFGLPRTARVALVVAQLIPRKGHGVLLAALQQPPLADRDLTVVLLGTGPLRAALEREIARAGLSGRVMLAGHRPDVERLLPGADLLVHPAVREGLGVAVLEAMAAGVPVVAAAAGGLVDLIRPGIDGRLVPPADPAALAAAVAALLDAPALGRACAAAARARVIARFGVDAMTDACLKLYEELVSTPDALLGH